MDCENENKYRYPGKDWIFGQNKDNVVYSFETEKKNPFKLFFD